MTLAIRLASWARASSSQNTAGAPVARARVTASLTQSRIGTSLVWQARQMSPAVDLVLDQDVARRVDHAHHAGGRDLEGLVVAAVLLGRLGHQADVGHRAHRGRVEGAVRAAVVDDDLVDAGVATVRDHRERVVPPRRRGPHMWPEVRIIAGIDASTITSLGTCRLVMPLSESTIAMAGPSAQAGLDRRLDRGALVAGSVRDGLEDGTEAVVRGRRRRRRAARRTARRPSGKNTRTTWPKMIGSETFIMVALRCTENSTPSALARAICSVRNSRSAATFMTVRVDDLAGQHRHRLLEHGHRAVRGDVLDAQRVVGVDDHRLLVVAEVAVAHGRDVGLASRRDQAPIECGCLRA